MLIVKGHDVPAAGKGASLAIGNFDGVHRGHQALIAQAIGEARRLGAPAGVMVFEPHPREFFQPREPHFILTPLPMKLARLEALGLDLAVVMTFDAAFAGLTAAEFVSRVLVGELAVRHVVVGYDFFFGKGRQGTPETMREAGRTQGFGVGVVAPVAEDGEVFSSTAVRLKLAQGDVGGAAHDLGDWWRVEGPVIGGAKRGTGLGYPTANLRLPPGTALAHGIYAVRVDAGDGVPRLGAAYIGTRPTFDHGAVLLEVFLLDFSGDLYGREIEVAFVGFVRGDRKFHSEADLKRQMDEDVAVARRLLAAAPDRPV
jgi:riboflavin kinase/FMN adenylyltransferase